MICKFSLIKSKGVFNGRTMKMSKTVTKIFWEKFNFCKFGSIKNSFQSIECSFDWFDWSKRNWEPIDLGRNSMMKFFIVLIDGEFLSIDRIFFSVDWIRIENKSNETITLWCISSFFCQSRKIFDRSKALNFEFSLVFD